MPDQTDEVKRLKALLRECIKYIEDCIEIEAHKKEYVSDKGQELLKRLRMSLRG